MKAGQLLKQFARGVAPFAVAGLAVLTETSFHQNRHESGFSGLDGVTQDGKRVVEIDTEVVFNERTLTRALRAERIISEPCYVDIWAMQDAVKNTLLRHDLAAEPGYADTLANMHEASHWTHVHDAWRARRFSYFGDIERELTSSFREISRQNGCDVPKDVAVRITTVYAPDLLKRVK